MVIARALASLLVFGLVVSVLALVPVLAVDNNDSVGVADRTTGIWYLRSPGGQTTSFFFGNPGDYPIMGDWNCDGVDTPGLYRQSDGYVYLRNSNTQGPADVRFFFGDPGDIPLAGDFDGDGCDTVSIYRPAEARVFVINELGSNDGGLGAADFAFYFGDVGDKPLTADFDDDGIDEVGLHRESTGFVYYRNTLTTGIADNEFFYGDPGDQILSGRWVQNLSPGPDTVGIFRPSQGEFYLRFSNNQGNADTQFPYGNSNMAAVAGRFGSLPGGDLPPPGTNTSSTTTTPPTTVTTTSTPASTTTSTSTTTTTVPPPEWRVSEIVSVSTGEVQGNAASGYFDCDTCSIDISADGRYVAFRSSASNLVAGDDNFLSDIFLRDLQTGATERIGLDAGCCTVGISGDGRIVTFRTATGSLYIYIRDAANRTVSSEAWQTISTSGDWVYSIATSGDSTISTYSVTSGGQSQIGRQSSQLPPSISGDGDLVTVQVGGFIDQPTVKHVAVYDRSLGVDELASVSSSGVRGNLGGIQGFVSESGRWVAFASRSTNLDPADTDDSYNLYLRDRVLGTTRVLPGATFTKTVGMSSDGRWLTGPGGEVYDTVSGTETRYSTAFDGSQPNNSLNGGGHISSDGSRIVFSSRASNLVPSDLNGWDDVFLATFK